MLLSKHTIQLRTLLAKKQKLYNYNTVLTRSSCYYLVSIFIRGKGFTHDHFKRITLIYMVIYFVCLQSLERQ